MAWLTEARAAVKDALTVDGDLWNSWDYSPEKIVAPAIALTYGSPLLEDGTTFADYQIRFVLTLIPDVGTNEAVTDALDKFIETSVTRLLDAGYGIEQVGQPYMLDANNARYFAVDLSVLTDVQPG